MLELFYQRFPAATQGLIPGVDVSGWQTPAQWNLPWVRFMVAKASEGSGFTEGSLVSHAAQAAAMGIPWGAYHFARYGDVQAEVDRYLFSLSPAIAAYGLPAFHALDLEAPYVGDLTAWAETWCRRVEAAIARPVVIYTGPAYANTHLANPNFGLQARPLWLAHYASAGVTRPDVPRIWSDFAIWQWTDTSAIGSLDLNVAKPEFLELVTRKEPATPGLVGDDERMRTIRTPDGTLWAVSGVLATPYRNWDAYLAEAAAGRAAEVWKWENLDWPQVDHLLCATSDGLTTIGVWRTAGAALK